MESSTNRPPSTPKRLSAAERGLTEEEEFAELDALVESMVLPRALEPPDSWKRIAAWLRVRFGRPAHPR